MTHDREDEVPRAAEADPGPLETRLENVTLVQVSRAGQPILILLMIPGISHLSVLEMNGSHRSGSHRAGSCTEASMQTLVALLSYLYCNFLPLFSDPASVTHLLLPSETTMQITTYTTALDPALDLAETQRCVLKFVGLFVTIDSQFLLFSFVLHPVTYCQFMV